MKKLNSLTNPLLGLDGQPLMNQVGTRPDGTPILVPETIGKTLANVLARGQSSDAVQAMMIAMRVHSEKSVDLEDADFALVREAVTKDTMLTNLGRAALLTALDGAQAKGDHNA